MSDKVNVTTQTGAQGETPVAWYKSRKFWIGLLIFVLGYAALYVLFAQQYRTRYFEGTFINGEDVSLKTVDEVEEMIREKVEDYELSVTFRGNKSHIITAEDIGYHYVSDNHAQKIVDDQNIYEWVRGRLGETFEYTVSEDYSFDKDLLHKVVFGFPEFAEKNQKAPTNAFLNLKDDNTFEIVKETQGNKLKMDEAYGKIEEAVNGTVDKVSFIANPEVYEAPTVYADNPDLNAGLDALNKFLDTKIVYDLPNGEQQVLDRTTLKDWVTRQDNGYYYLDPANIEKKSAEYIGAIAAKIDDVHYTQNFASTNRGTIELSCPKWGREVDQEAETAQVLADLENSTSTEREPAYALNHMIDESFGGDYIEVDLINQTVYVYKDHSIIFDCPCVSGTNTVPSRRTVTGVFDIYSKERNRTLKGAAGPDGTPSYTSFVNFWMPFYEGYGLHDAPWRGSFGGSIYEYSGSHGCVNLSYGSAETIWNNCEVGTPVIVF